MKKYVNSSPTFFRLIQRAFLGGSLALLLLAWLIPAPLEPAADLGLVPNPSKSAWFLLWMQELVSYSTVLIYLILLLGIFLGALPWLPGTRPATQARWFPTDQRLVNAVTITLYAAIIILTVVGLFFRGENWSFVLPF